MPNNISADREEAAERTAENFDGRSGINFRCPHCAGTLIYSIEKRKMRCESCESLFAVRDLEDPTAAGKEGNAPEMETVEHRCPSCGAALHSTKTGITSFCSFCGSDAVLTERVSRIRRPDKIIPFTVTREECAEIYRQRIRRSPFVPKEMRTENVIDRFRPVYIPFWNISGKGNGPFHVNYTQSVSEGEMIRTDTYEEDREGTITVYNLFYDASTQFDDETAQWLQFRGDSAVPFHPAYLSGLYAESADTNSENFHGLARQYASESLENSSQSVPANFKEEAKLVLMPVWLLPSRQGEKVVYTAIRGASREPRIHCELPVSPKRFTLGMGLLTLLIAALVLFLHQYVILRPQITVGLGCLLTAFCWNAAAPFLEKVHARRNDNDPTRKMLRQEGGGGDIRGHLLRAEQKKETGSLLNPIINYFKSLNPLHDTDDEELYEASPSMFSIPMKTLLPFILVLSFLYFIISMMTMGRSNNMLRVTNSMISDNSTLPSMLAAVSGLIMLEILLRNPNMGTMNLTVFISQFILFILMITLRALQVQVDKNLFYAAGLINFALTLLVMLNAFRVHNQYVSRPVPFFEDQEGEK